LQIMQGVIEFEHGVIPKEPLFLVEVRTRV